MERNCLILSAKGVDRMNAEFVRERITQLRLQKGISEYKMSYDLGHSRGYINNISSGKTLPSMTEFFAICDYFQITSVQFFQSETDDPCLTQEVQMILKRCNGEKLELIAAIVKKWLKD